MSDVIKFKLERQGFPISIGDNNFFIGTSMEDLQKFFIDQEKVEEKIKKIQIDIKEISTKEGISKEKADTVIKKTKELTKVQYDSMLGPGAFDQIYTKFPYVDVLLENFDDIAVAISDRIEQDTEKRKDKYNNKKAELMKKKALKNKKK